MWSSSLMKNIVFASLLLFTQGGILQFNKIDSIGELQSNSGIHSRAKRNTPASSTCKDLADDLKNILTNKTVSYTFTDDPNQSISLTWTGTNVLALTSEVSIIPQHKSMLYRSKDRGKTFEDISSKLGGAIIRKTSGILTSPLNSKKLIMFGADTIFQTSGTSLFISEDAGETFKKVVLTFKCSVGTIQFSPFHENKILMKSNDNSLYSSNDFGHTWTWENDHVNSVQWDPKYGDTYYYSLDPYPERELDSDSMEDELYRVGDNGEHTLIAKDVHSFVLKDQFLLLSVQFCGRNGSRVLYVSKNQGHAWNAAQVPMIGKDEFYSLLDMTEEMIFLHVDTPGDTGHGDIYTSDERGIVFDKSLSRHLYPNGKGVHDFYKVDSFDGTYITSQLSEDNTVHTVITHDKGGKWEKIENPTSKPCPATEKECKLQIHNYFSASKSVSLPAYPLSSNNTVGLIVAHGNIGDALSIQTPDVYISRDGGYGWKQPDELTGPHHYGIGDSGGVIFAIQYSKEPINIIKYSLDEGDCWHTHNFTTSPGIVVTGLLAEPGHQAKDVTVWGYHPSKPGNPWTVFFIDFKSVMRKACTNEDYEKWDAHDGGCILGSKRSYMRRKADTTCSNDHQLDVKASHLLCTCQQSVDYMCDFGYSKKGDSSDCTIDNRDESRDICIDGEEKLVTQTYRKIPGDKCTGGDIAQTTPRLIAKNCEVFNYTGDGDPTRFPSCYKNVPLPSAATSSNIGLIVFLVLLIIVMSVALGVVVYYKRRSLIRVQYREMNSDRLLVVDDDLLESGDGNQQEGKQNGSLVAGSSYVGGGDLAFQSPGNLPTSNDTHVSSSDLGRPTNAHRSYHDDSDDEKLLNCSVDEDLLMM